MKSWILRESPGNYEWGDIDVPEPGPLDVRVKVVASALNHMDVWISAGTYEARIAEQARLLEKHFPGATLTLTHDGHSFGAWRERVPAMLRHFFPR